MGGIPCTARAAHQAKFLHCVRESRAFTAYTGDNTAIYGAACYLPDRIGHLYKCRPPPPSDIMQPGDRRLHWLPIAVDCVHTAHAEAGTLTQLGFECW